MTRCADHNITALTCFESLPGDSNVRLPVMLCLYGCSRATLYRYINKGFVPKPHRLGERISVWQVSEVKESLQKLHKASSECTTTANH